MTEGGKDDCLKKGGVGCATSWLREVQKDSGHLLILPVSATGCLRFGDRVLYTTTSISRVCVGVSISSEHAEVAFKLSGFEHVETHVSRIRSTVQTSRMMIRCSNYRALPWLLFPRVFFCGRRMSLFHTKHIQRRFEYELE